MRICFLGLEILPSGKVFAGGLVNNVIRLANGLINRGHEVVIVTSNVRKSLGSATLPSLYKIYAIPCHGRYASTLHGIEFLIRASFQFLTSEFDIIHIHSAYPILGLLSVVSRLTGSIPSVFTLYSPLRSQPLKDRKGIYQLLSVPLLSKFYLRGINTIVAVSDNVRRSLNLAGLDEDDVDLIPPAVDSRFFRRRLSPKDKEKFGFRKDVPIILYCGNWAPWKGVDVLIESMVTITEKFPQAKLITAWNEVYDWYDERKIEIRNRIKELGLENNIIEMGVLENIYEVMGACDVLVAPFLNTDGVADYPLTILEAMACGKPVVATRVGGIPEIISDRVNGVLVHPNDPKELGNAICCLLGNKNLADQISRNAMRYASENFSLDPLLKKCERIYENLVKKT